MAQVATLRIIDYVNVKFEGLDPVVRRRLASSLSFFVPHARHTMAFKLGRWDGKKSFATAGGGTYLNLLELALPVVLDAGYEVDIEDQRTRHPESFTFTPIDENFLADKLWPEGHPLAGQPILLRDYQVEAINRYLTNPQSLQSISTGAGKTVITACLSKICEQYGRTVTIVPSKSLVEQTEEDFLNIGLDTGVFFGDRKEWSKKHTICTWQSLAALSKRTRREEIDEGFGIHDLLEGVVCVQVDEAHTIKGEELLALLTGPAAQVPIRWGMTGTIPKGDWEFVGLLASIGPVVGEIKAADLQAKGVLADCDIDVIQLVDDHVEFVDYASEIDFLVKDRARLVWLADRCREWAEQGNTLVLVDRIETGEVLLDMLPDAVFINGSVKNKDRKREYKSVQTSDGKLVIATYGVAAVGINIPRLFNVVMLEPGKSFTRVIQSIGRGLRKAKDKSFVHIKDIGSTLKFSHRHKNERVKFYKEAGYPHGVRKVVYRD